MASDKKSLIRENRRRNFFFLPRRKVILLISSALILWLLFSVYKFVQNSEARKFFAPKSMESSASLDHLAASKEQDESKRKLVILWTPFFSQKNYVLPLEQYSCPITNCDFIANRSLIQEADAVMFHARDTDLYDLPKFRRPNQRWILLHHEAPPNTPVNLFEGLNDLINMTVTYRTDSDVVLTPKYRRKAQGSENRMQAAPKFNKTRLVAWFVSNCKTDSHREEFVQELRKTVTIDVFGSCGPYTCHPKMSNKCYQTIEREYFFYLSLENSICKDYITEKLFNLLDYHIIPVAFGGVNEQAFLPPDSFIDVFKFKSTAALGQHLIKLAKNREAYDKFFRWKDEYEMETYQHYACQICSQLNANPSTSRSWKRLSQWWYEESHCRSWSAGEEYENK